MNSATMPESPQAVTPSWRDVFSQCRTDILIGLVVALVAGVAAWSLAIRIPPAVLDPRNPDIYFSSDISRVQENMVSRTSNHWRTGVHPLFSLELFPAFHVVAALLGADLHNNPLSPASARVGYVMSGLAAGLAAGIFYALLRTARIRRADSLLFCALAMLSAFAIFWFSVPETYPWGAVTILLGLWLAAAQCRRQLAEPWYIVANVLTLSVTTTNWMVGILANWSRYKLIKAVKLTILALVITAGLSIVQKLIFPSSWFFFRIKGEKAYVMMPQGGGPLRCWASFFSHTMVMPQPHIEPHTRAAGQSVIRTQFANPASAPGLAGKVALACWALLLAAGVYAIFAVKDFLPFRLVLGLSLLGQLGLHTIFGPETFLYCANYGPMMIALAALATLTPLRKPVLALTAVMVVCLALNNLPQFDWTVDVLVQSQKRLDTLPANWTF